jgi:membrane protein implicated in regulation of membrane protease activity
MLALIMIVSEIIAGGMYSLPFAVGAGCAALAEWLRPGSANLQWALFLGVTVVLFGALQRMRQREK